MAGFLYFVPNHTRQVTHADVRAWGLGYAFEQSPTSGLCHGNTPSGTAGSVFGDERRHDVGRIKIDRPNQEWREWQPTIGGLPLWIGYWKDARPAPQDLARSHQLPGYELPLADGRKWHIPLVRCFDEASGLHRSRLPSYLDVDEHGQVVPGRVVEVYAHLWELTAPYAEQMLAGDADAPEVDLQKIYRDAVALLQVNYVVDMIEVVQAAVMTTEQMAHAIVTVAIDWPTYASWCETAKKKTSSPAIAGDLCTSPGHAA